MKIYTKTGDGGNTGLQGDFRIAKSHPRIILMEQLMRQMLQLVLF